MPPSQPNPDVALATPAAVGRRVERRQVTVMFVDMVGSSRLARTLDPDDFGQVTLAYRQAAAGVIRANGGHVARYLGDGILAMWGYPVAREDGPQRAVLAGLAVHAAVAEAGRILARPGLSLVARVGLSAGIVLAGRLEGVAAEAGGDVLGEAPNQADRIQKHAAPGETLASGVVRALTDAAFDFEPAGELADAGAGHLPLFRVLRARPGQLRARPVRTPGLFGRTAEQGALAAWWAQAQAGDGLALVIEGEAGIGKSRLIDGLRAHVNETGGQWLGGYCLAETTATPLTPLREILRLSLAQAPGGDGPEALAAAAAAAGLAPAAARALERLLRPPPAAEPDGDGPTPAEALLDWLIAQAQSRPLVVAIEDLYWADGSTLAWLQGLAGRLAGVPLLVVATTRPGAAGELAALARLRLAPLPVGAVHAIVAALDPDGSIAPAQRRAILEKAEGNPLFAEELTLLARAGRSELLDLPSSLNTSLLARLDDLDAGARATAQAAAVLGRSFAVGLLAAMCALPAEQAWADVSRLVGHGLVVAPTREGGRFIFRHALIRDAAYRSLVRDERAGLHGRAARALVARTPEEAARQPELVARHFAEAGDAAEAAHWWREAGDRAAAVSAPREAAEAYAAALQQLDRAAAEAGASGAPIRADLMLRLGTQRLAIDGNAAASVRAAYAGAIAALDAAGLDAPDLRFRALRGLHTHAMVHADISEALAIGEELLRRAGSARAERLQAHRVQGLAALLAGRHAEAEAHYRAALALYDPVADADHRVRFGSDPRAVVLAQLAWGLAIAGRAGESNALAEEAARLATALDHAHTRAHVEGVDALRLLTLGERAAAATTATRIAGFATERGFAYWVAWCEVVRLAADPAIPPAEAASGLVTAIGAYGATGARQMLPLAHALRAERLIVAGQPRVGLAALREAASLSDATGLRLYAAEILRLTGVAAAALRVAEADRLLADAARLAETQGAGLLMLRAMADRLELGARGAWPAGLAEACAALARRLALAGEARESARSAALLAAVADVAGT